MKNKTDWPQEYIEYNPETGSFHWKKRAGQRGSVGAKAGTNSNGYVQIRFKGEGFKAHHIAWYLVYGKWPDMLDHINRNPSDNRIKNLRMTTSYLNHQNRKDNLPVPGIKTSKWGYAVHAKNRYIGFRKTYEDAVELRRSVDN